MTGRNFLQGRRRFQADLADERTPRSEAARHAVRHSSNVKHVIISPAPRLMIRLPSFGWTFIDASELRQTIATEFTRIRTRLDRSLQEPDGFAK